MTSSCSVEHSQSCRLLLIYSNNSVLILGVQLAEDKTFGPEKCLPFLGIELCTETMTAHLPLQKCLDYANELLHNFGTTFISKQHLSQFIGRLNRATSVIQGGLPFIRRFIDCAVGLRHINQEAKVTSDLWADAKLWLCFLTNTVAGCYFCHLSGSYLLQ